MTIGGWLLGLAWVALTAARRARWPVIVCPVLFLALFGILETAVIVSFRDRLTLSSPLAWGYLATILATFAFAIVALADAWRRWPAVPADGPLFGSVTRFFVIVFIVLVARSGSTDYWRCRECRRLTAAFFPNCSRRLRCAPSVHFTWRSRSP
jgi:hypothetical protein